MGKRSKFTAAEKLKALRDYETGEFSRNEISNKYGVNFHTFRNWLDIYNEYGEAGFIETSVNQSYSVKFKLQAVSEYNNGLGSYSEICNKHRIKSNSTLLFWVRKYNGHKEIKEYKPLGGVYDMKARKTTLEEKIEIVNFCIENNYNYKLSANKYKVNYSQIYNWVKRYEEFGAQGLEDNRGRRKIVSKLTEEDMINIKIRKLEKTNKQLQMENDVLKKLNEVERRLYSQKSNKNQNT